jgi:ArsR family transcriptional regulator
LIVGRQDGPLHQWVRDLSVLADPIRVRILCVLRNEELGVGEIARTLGVPQSTASRHLKPLHEAGLVLRRGSGTRALHAAAGVPAAGVSTSAAAQLWAMAADRAANDPAVEQDRERLRQVLAERRTDSVGFFGRVAGEWDAMRRTLFGDHFMDEALCSLVPHDWVVADLGCGTGEVAERLAPLVRKVVLVDREPAMLDGARKRLKGSTNCEFRKGDLLDLPGRAGEWDAAVAMLVLHHIEQPALALRQAARCLKPGGTMLVVDLAPHDHEEFRHRMGHAHLGFSQADLAGYAAAAGLRLVRWHRLRPDTHSRGPGLFAGVLAKPAKA